MVEEMKNYLPPDFKSGRKRFLAEVINGLHKPQKELPCKYFYDDRGSHLFEKICTLDEYYIPSTEEAIMQANIEEMATLIGPHVMVIEYGSGDCKKVHFLLDHLQDPVAYVPIDISGEQLVRVTSKLLSDYNTLDILPVCADYTSSFDIPNTKRKFSRKFVYFPGSTIGNFDSDSARQFLEHIVGICSPNGAVLIGVDLKKDINLLHNAYNDKQGVTAEFNLNILQRLNNELNCDFHIDSFQHYAFYNPKESRVEMHLVSLREQTIHIGKVAINFTKGESIWTESSYKYNLDEFQQIAATAGLQVERIWTDQNHWFSVQYLIPSDGTLQF
ncbi:MAG: L-histidine N(alpha)-methyltransferase [Chloroflexi bacterium]|nr:L-histidine N(alpha)-methyltransferase [Chloroflexota bacterium]